MSYGFELPDFDLSVVELGPPGLPPPESKPAPKFVAGTTCYVCARPPGRNATTIRNHLTVCEVCSWVLSPSR